MRGLDLHGKRCLVTGAASGIGRATGLTSPDGRFLHWLQRKFSPSYELIMRLMNRELDRAAS